MAREKTNPTTITGLQAFRGEGAPAARGFWADAWGQVLRQPGAVVGLAWVGVVAFFAIFAPVISSGHPMVRWEIDGRTGADAASWFAQEVTVGGTGQRVREGLSNDTARALLEREFGRHAGVNAAEGARQVMGDAAAGDMLLASHLESILAAIRAYAPLESTGEELPPSSPLLSHLKAADWAILVGGVLGIVVMVLPKGAVGGLSRGARAGLIATGALQAAASIVVASFVSGYFTSRDAPDWARRLETGAWFVPLAATACASLLAAMFCAIGAIRRSALRVVLSLLVAAGVATILAMTWRTPPGSFDAMERERLGQIRAIYTLVPWSSNQRPSDRDASALPPGATHDQALANLVRSAIPPPGQRAATPADVERAIRLTRELPLASDVRDRIASDLQATFGGQSGVSRVRVGEVVREHLRGVGKAHLLGTDKFGQDVLAQILHACRLAISMGIVATGLATVIGVTMGALMGYFGGWVDMLLYRVVEIFMAIPLLFLLIVAAGVLERNTYVMMAIIGCVTWHGAARFTRAEFMKLRSQDFVQSARAVGLPLRSILFKHMLPNGVTPVLVDASFGIAAAIQFEAVLSYLGLGPPDQPSWGRVLADAAGESGTFNWWLGVFPGLAIFLTVLSLTMVGEALRDAIDPKLKKARV